MRPSFQRLDSEFPAIGFWDVGGMDALKDEVRMKIIHHLALKFLSFVLTLAAARSVLAAESAPPSWFLSPAGNDAWSGTLPDPNVGKTDGPFTTPARARDAARAAIAKGLTKDLVIQLRGGTYHLSEPLILGPEDGGTKDRAVIWAAAPGEVPVLSAGRPIAGWKPGDGGFWTVDLPDVKAGRWHFRQLFVDGARRPRARAPNDGFFRIVAAGPDNRTSFTFKPGDIRAWARLGDAEVVFLHDWCTSRVALDAVDEAAHTVRLKHPIGKNANHYRISHFEKTPRYAVENALELLDAPGEWYLDREAGRLYYKPMPGEAPDRTEAVAGVLDRVIEVRGEAGKPVRNLRFAGLTFAYTEWPLPPFGYAEGQSSFYEVRQKEGKPGGSAPVPPAVRVESAIGCAFERCRFAHLGGSGLWLAKGCHDARVDGCVIEDVAANGILIGDGAALRKGSDGRFLAETEPDLVAQRNRVTHCLIQRCGAVFHGAVGVWIGITDGTVVARNELRDLPYTGISVGWVWNPSPSPAKDSRIEGNHIHHIMRVLSDGGGIYSLGRLPGTAFRGNLIHDVPVNAGRAESNGIFMDEGSSEVTVEGNVIYGIAKAPIRFHKVGKNVLRKNTLVPAAGKEPFTFNACKKEVNEYEGNETPAAAAWKPPAPEAMGAGRG